MGQMTISPFNTDGTKDMDFKQLEMNIGRLGVNSNEAESSMLRTLKMIDFIQATNRYKWSNLPQNIYGWYIEKMLYYAGSICGFKEGENFLVLPYAMVNGINLFGLPYKIQPIALNGQPFGAQKLAVGMFGELTGEEANATILYSLVPEFSGQTCVPQFAIDEPILRQMSYRFAMMKKNIKQSFLSYIFRCLDDKQKEALEMAFNGTLESINEKIAMIVRGDFNLENLAIPRDYESQSLWQDVTSFNNQRLVALGIQNAGTFLKKERVVGQESETQDEQSRLVLDSGLQMRKLWAEQTNKMFGFNIGVELNNNLEKFEENTEKQLTIEE